MNDTVEHILRRALEQYADDSNWLPTGFNPVDDDLYYITFVGMPEGDLHGRLIAERALKEVDDTDRSSLVAIAKAAQKYLSLPRTNQANVHRHSEYQQDLIEVLEDAGYPVTRPVSPWRVDDVIPLRSHQKPQEQKNEEV